MSQVASTCDTNVEYQIWSVCDDLFLSYVDNTRTGKKTHTHRPTAKNEIFGFRRLQSMQTH